MSAQSQKRFERRAASEERPYACRGCPFARVRGRFDLCVDCIDTRVRIKQLHKAQRAHKAQCAPRTKQGVPHPWSPLGRGLFKRVKWRTREAQ